MRITVISPGIYTYGAMLIGGVLRDAGYEVTLRRDMHAGKGDMVMLSLFSTQHLISPEIRNFISGHRAGGDLCYVGGPVSAYPEMVLGELRPDAVALGEGEETVLRLAEEGISEDIPGLAWLDSDNKMVSTGIAPQADVNHPLPLIPKDIGQQSVRGASAYIETHRGCTGACTFCQVPRFFGRSIRSRDLESIIAEAEAFRKMGATRLSVSGGTGSLYQYKNGKINEEAFVELMKGLASVMGPRNISSPDIRVDCISDTILDAIRDYTIGWVFFGLETASEPLLHRMGKGASVEDARVAIRRCREHGLKVAGSFIVGYPTETEEDYLATKEFIAEECLDDVFISIAEPIPSTPLADLVLRTPREENPLYMEHTGEYHSLKLSEAEARSFDLQMHADMFKPVLHVVTDQVFSAYLEGVRKDGIEVKAATEVLYRYYGQNPIPR